MTTALALKLRNLGAEPWRAEAICRSEATGTFYPTRGESQQAAKAICARCPVRQPCLDYAMEYGEPMGIFGGLNEVERGRLRRRRV